MNLSELRKLAAEADINPADPDERIKLTAGEKYLLKVEKVVRNDPDQKERDGYGVMFRVVEGPDYKNRVFWDNFNFITEYPNLVAKTLYDLGEIVGGQAAVDRLFEASDDEARTNLFKDRKVECVAKYRNGYNDHKYTLYDDIRRIQT